MATDTGRTLTGRGTLPAMRRWPEIVSEAHDARWGGARSARRAVRGRAGGDRSAARRSRTIRRAGRLDREAPRDSSSIGTPCGPPAAVFPVDGRSTRIIASADLSCDRATAVPPSRPLSMPSRADGPGRAPERRWCRRSSIPIGSSKDPTIVRGHRERSARSRVRCARRGRPAFGSRSNGCEPWRPLLLGSALAGGVVDHAEAGGAMRSQRHVASGTRGRGQGLFSLAVLVVSSAGGSRSSEASAPRPQARQRRRRSGPAHGSVRTAGDRSNGRPRCISRTPATGTGQCGCRRFREEGGGSRSPSRVPPQATVSGTR